MVRMAGKVRRMVGEGMKKTQFRREWLGKMMKKM